MRIKRITNFLVCVVLMLSLLGCSNEVKVTEGEVCNKEYREAYTALTMYPVTFYDGKNVHTRLVPYSVYYPERYVIFVKAYIDGEWVTEDFYVSEDAYESINIGDMFSYDEGRGDLKDEPYTKTRKEATKDG